MPHQTPRRFLIIEDEKGLNGSLKRRLDRLGWETDACYDGEQGLEKMREKSYDGIVLDLLMPVKDGFVVLAQRGTTKNAATPIYVLTSLPEDQYQLAVVLGARKVFAKSETTPSQVADTIARDLSSAA